ncbi:MAG: 2'-5' RNA ligase family protein [Nanoarchaeota archaeon]
MRYIVSFSPNKELSDLILRQNQIVLPGSGLHSTLCVFNIEPELESGLVSDLSKVRFDSFEIETLGFEDFDNDSLVLKLSRPDALLQLHNKVISAVENYVNPDFDEIAKKYYGNNYNPHLTISKSSSGFNRTSKELIGQKDLISSYRLAKKEGNWKDIQIFYSNQ